TPTVALFLNNGLGPVKDENSFTFVYGRVNGIGVLSSVELNLTVPFLSPGGDDLGAIRVAFPKYIERPLVYDWAVLKTKDQKIPLTLAEDLNAVSFQVLHQRMLAEVTKAVVRLALKQLAEYALREKSEGLGMLLSVANAVTEKADTRNWQTLPHSILYSKISLEKANQDLSLLLGNLKNKAIQKEIPFTLDLSKAKNNQTILHYMHITDHRPAYNN
ncbi:MAG: hypothetical protein ACKO7P_02965, partial [Bacteroidota bacterium]